MMSTMSEISALLDEIKSNYKDKNVLLIKGSVPGNKGSILKIRNSVKSAK